MDQDTRDKIKEIVGQENFTDLLIDLVSYSYDASDNDHRPDAAVWPNHAEQISKILKLANERGFPVIPRGAGTGLSGSAVPIKGGLVIDMCRMNQILDIRIEDRLALVQPGVVYDHLQKALAPYGFFFPPDPASGKVCTIGGNVATNAGGMRAAKYGVTRDYVLGLDVVLPDGRIMKTGSSCMKSVSGYDLTRLFVGSEGTLGIVTEITLKIQPNPPSTKTALALFHDLEKGGRAISHIIRAGVVPSVLELLDENTIRVLREHGGMAIPDAKVMILTETDGYTEVEAAHQMGKIVRVFRENGAAEIKEASSKEEVDELWRARRSAGSVASSLRPNNVSEDVAVPVSKLPELLTGISRIIQKYDLPFASFGHAGDGNIHPRIMFDRTDPDQVERMERAVDEIFKLACEMGGTLTGEHGIGLSKAPYLSLEHDSVAIDIMRSMKKLFDPKDILNPGKMNLVG